MRRTSHLPNCRYVNRRVEPHLRHPLLTPSDPFVKVRRAESLCETSANYTLRYWQHHGALGGFVRVHLTQQSDADIDNMLEQCRKLPQVEIALSGKDAASLFEMPVDREGELVVIAKENAAIGSRQDEHDLSHLEGHRLRSHGGLSEQDIPLLRSIPIDSAWQGRAKAWRNFDIFDLALNY